MTPLHHNTARQPLKEDANCFGKFLPGKHQDEQVKRNDQDVEQAYVEVDLYNESPKYSQNCEYGVAKLCFPACRRLTTRNFFHPISRNLEGPFGDSLNELDDAPAAPVAGDPEVPPLVDREWSPDDEG